MKYSHYFLVLFLSGCFFGSTHYDLEVETDFPEKIKVAKSLNKPVTEGRCKDSDGPAHSIAQLSLLSQDLQWWGNNKQELLERANILIDKKPYTIKIRQQGCAHFVTELIFLMKEDNNNKDLIQNLNWAKQIVNNVVFSDKGYRFQDFLLKNLNNIINNEKHRNQNCKAENEYLDCYVSDKYGYQSFEFHLTQNELKQNIIKLTELIVP